MIKDYISLTKPGIIFGNMLTVFGGFYLGKKNLDKLANFSTINYHSLLFFTLIAVGLIIASGCVLNNIIDRDIDKLMQRTCNRVLVKGIIKPSTAFFYALLLGITGLLILYYQVNALSAMIAVFALIIYVVLYSLWFKRHSVHGTLIGSFSGAAPIVIGYCAVTKNFDSAALILFIILSLWQMPHSYAISIFRLDDYKAAKIPLLVIRSGIKHTKIMMLVYIVLFGETNLLLMVYDYSTWYYQLIIALMNIVWIILCLQGFYTENNKKWAKKMFSYSILLITALSVGLAI